MFNTIGDIIIWKRRVKNKLLEKVFANVAYIFNHDLQTLLIFNKKQPGKIRIR